jgi:hypothetical protein
MRTNKETAKTPFVTLDEPVSFASSSARVVRTNQVGRVLGFGCSGEEQQSFDALESFAKEAREHPERTPSNFEQELHNRVAALERSVVTAQRQRTQKS